MDIFLVFDMSIFIMLLVLGNLSARIGEALMIPPYYKILWGEAFLILLIPITEIIIKEFTTIGRCDYVAYIRAVVLIPAIPVVQIYWKWLLKEDLK
jgi:hypothetical protein